LNQKLYGIEGSPLSFTPKVGSLKLLNYPICGEKLKVNKKRCT